MSRPHRPQALVIAATLALLAGCAGMPPAPASVSGAETADGALIPANPKKGFHFPYILRLPPAGGRGAAPFLLVEPNNSGHVSTDFQDHIDAALALAKQGVGGDVARRLAAPFVMPVFPRSPDLYTHSLSRQTLLTGDPRLKRLDLQLLAMIADARHRLAKQGIRVNHRVFLTGFSASGMFVTRFAALHPDAVQALAAGGVNGFVILPLERIGATTLPFPLGVADLADVADRPFDADEWRRIPQFLFMGAEDTNDAVQNDDAYSAGERAVIHEHLGERMLPDRWDECRRIYRDAGASATFTTYPGLDHATNGRVHAEIADFLSRASLSPHP